MYSLNKKSSPEPPKVLDNDSGYTSPYFEVEERKISSISTAVQTPPITSTITSNFSQQQPQPEYYHQSSSLANNDKFVHECLCKLTTHVISLQQQLYTKDIIIKNLFLRLNEFKHISFPQLHIDRIEIKNNGIRLKKQYHSLKKLKNSSSEKKSDGKRGGNKRRLGRVSVPALSSTVSLKQNNNDVSTVSLAVYTHWLPRSNIQRSIKLLSIVFCLVCTCTIICMEYDLYALCFVCV